MPVSIYDIAKVAKVSPSTVSRALDDHPRIGAVTKKRIQELASEMGYIPSTVARSLTAKKTWTIGLVLASVSDPFMGRVVEGVEQAAIEVGFNVFISTSQNDQQREAKMIGMLQKRRVDGIIALASHLFDRSPWLNDPGKVPIVCINEQDLRPNMHVVTIDDRHAAQLAVEHLIALGHRRIGYVSIPNPSKENEFRLKGYRDALTSADIAVDPALIFTSSDLEEHAKIGEASLIPLLSAGATAVFCYNDATAIGVLTACYKHGFSIPEHLSVIGFDDIDMAAYTIPPLTTIRQPRFELGQRAMHMMLALLDNQEPENQVVPCELVVRQTTAHFQIENHIEVA